MAALRNRTLTSAFQTLGQTTQIGTSKTPKVPSTHALQIDSLSANNQILGRPPLWTIIELPGSLPMEGKSMTLTGRILFSSVPPSYSLVSVSDPLRAFEMTRLGALQGPSTRWLMELQRYKDTVRCAERDQRSQDTVKNN